jgi:maleate cis-trans isomerase
MSERDARLPRTVRPGMTLPPDARPRLGFLYPRGGSAHEYYRFAEDLDGMVRCYLIGGMHAYGGAKTHYAEPLFRMGDVENLAYPARSMRPLDVHSVIWCSTSASFVGGMDWSRDQARRLGEIVGAPASNTSLAFAGALGHLRVDRVAVLASYPEEATDLFRRFLGEAGIEVSDFIHLDADAGEDAYNFPLDFLIERAMTLDVSRAGALLVPDTAMAAFPLMRALEDRMGLPVLTANGVSIWKALALAGVTADLPGYGRLFEGGGPR